MKVKEESEKAGWKLSMQKIKIMATNPIIMAHIRGKSTNNDRFYFLEVQNHCGHLFEAMKLKATCSSDGKLSRLDNLLKSRDITLPTNVHVVKAMVLPIVMFGSESWSMKKAECQRTDAFELWCWGRLLRVPWSARRSNQSVLKEINSEYSLEGLMMKLKLPYFGHLIWSAYSLENTLMLGKIEGRRRRGWQRINC